MESDYGVKCYAVNRLDRLTSGLMIMGLTGKASGKLAEEFREGTVKKQYVARVKGRFPEYAPFERKAIGCRLTYQRRYPCESATDIGGSADGVGDCCTGGETCRDGIHAHELRRRA